ncbi:MAG TPA: acetyl-CoA carboxylase biotin carboxyl carrier protein subunit, partial [Thermococcus paralvinellae]|nr:acetyl-CoA carboxylase biotin carboxyl carrier protein subunit [Thermococcus paralvinellae]
MKMVKVKVTVDGVTYEVEVEELGMGRFRVSFDGESYEVEAKDLGLEMQMPAQVQTVSAPTPSVSLVSQVSSVPSSASASVGEGVVCAPMPGK